MNTRKQEKYDGGEKITAYKTNKLVNDAYKNQESIHSTVKSFEHDGTLPNGMKPLVNLDFIHDIYSIPNSTGTGTISSTNVADVLTITNTPSDSLTINSNGDLETVAGGDFSFIHENDGERRGLFLDGNCTSLLTTADMSDALWNKTGVTVSPLGNILGDDVVGYRITTDSTDGAHYTSISTTSGTGQHKHIFLVRKSENMQYIRTQMVEVDATTEYVYKISFDLKKMTTYGEDDSVINSGMVELKDDWVLCWVLGGVTYGSTSSTCSIHLPDPSDSAHENLSYAGAGEYIDVALPCVIHSFCETQLPHIENGNNASKAICVGQSLSPVTIPRTSLTVVFDLDIEVTELLNQRHIWTMNPSPSIILGRRTLQYASIYPNIVLNSYLNGYVASHGINAKSGGLVRIQGACSFNSSTGEVKSVINGELITDTLSNPVFYESDNLHIFLGNNINSAYGNVQSMIFKSFRIYGDFIEDNNELIALAN